METIGLLEETEKKHRIEKIPYFLTSMKWLVLVLKNTLIPKFTQ